MLTTEDVYIEFRKAQAQKNNRGYRLPKNWDKHFGKMNKKNKTQSIRTRG